MKWFLDLKIGTKLLMSFGVVLLLTLIMGVTAILSMARINEASTTLATQWLPSVQQILTIKANIGQLRRDELSHVLTTDAPHMADIESKMAVTLDKIDADEKKYGAVFASTEDKLHFDKMIKLQADYIGQHNQLMALSRTMKKDEATVLLRGQSTVLLGELSTEIDKMVDINVVGGDKASSDADAAYSSARAQAIGFLVAAIVIGALLALWVARIISVPLTRAVAVARQVADGDLTADVQVDSRDETGQLMLALQHMTASLATLVGQVRSGTDTIATASGQIAAGNQDLSSRTEEQASSLEETASSMEELTSTVKQNADNARQANTLARSASGIAEKGGAVVGQVVGTMASINESSNKIVEIIAVIDGIAFQTNILALNAAVEAARAGEQGRGFAVVESEVRNLAQRSAAAAKEIKQLIGNSTEQVDLGARLVQQAGATMDEVVDSVRRVTDIMGEISAASSEQSAGIDQVNQAITQMDQVTQQNAALVEEAAAAADSMQEQAAQLAQSAAGFKLDPAMLATLKVSASTGVSASAAASASASTSASTSASAAARRPAPRLALAARRA